MKIHIFVLRWRDEIRRSSQLRTLLKLVVVNRTWKKKKKRPVRDLNPWPLRLTVPRLLLILQLLYKPLRVFFFSRLWGQFRAKPRSRIYFSTSLQSWWTLKWAIPKSTVARNPENRLCNGCHNIPFGWARRSRRNRYTIGGNLPRTRLVAIDVSQVASDEQYGRHSGTI